jgi:hypothetical protein
MRQAREKRISADGSARAGGELVVAGEPPIVRSPARRVTSNPRPPAGPRRKPPPKRRRARHVARRRPASRLATLARQGWKRLSRGLDRRGQHLLRAWPWLGRLRDRLSKLLAGKRPGALKLALLAALVLPVLPAANLAYHLAHKPTEIFFPFANSFDKTPTQTWRSYGKLFREYATAAVSPELLAALAQSEGAGNPLAHTYWRWRFSWNPFAVFQPASSAVGMYQMADAAFADARRYCIRDHRVVAEGCGFTGLYMRILPSHAIELAAVNLDRSLAGILAALPHAAPNARQRQDLAAVVHLCGASPAMAFARRGFRLAPGQRCGDHDPAAYVAKVDAMVRLFRRVEAASG